MSAGFNIGDRVRYGDTARDEHDVIGVNGPSLWIKAASGERYTVPASGCTLLPVPIPEGWVNVYPQGTGGSYATRPAADGNADANRVGVWELRADRTAEYYEVPR